MREKKKHPTVVNETPIWCKCKKKPKPRKGKWLNKGHTALAVPGTEHSSSSCNIVWVSLTILLEDAEERIPGRVSLWLNHTRPFHTPCSSPAPQICPGTIPSSHLREAKKLAQGYSETMLGCFFTFEFWLQRLLPCLMSWVQLVRANTALSLCVKVRYNHKDTRCCPYSIAHDQKVFCSHTQQRLGSTKVTGPQIPTWNIVLVYIC